MVGQVASQATLTVVEVAKVFTVEAVDIVAAVVTSITRVVAMAEVVMVTLKETVDTSLTTAVLLAAALDFTRWAVAAAVVAWDLKVVIAAEWVVIAAEWVVVAAEWVVACTRLMMKAFRACAEADVVVVVEVEVAIREETPRALDHKASKMAKETSRITRQ